MMKWFNKKKKDNKGFTLVELVIVVAILALLVGLLAPQYTKYVEKARKSADVSNMDDLVKAITVYAVEHGAEGDLGGEAKTITVKLTKSGVAGDDSTGLDEFAKNAFEEYVPDYTKISLKSKQWGENSDPTAVITIDADGGVKVEYSPEAFANYSDGKEKSDSGEQEEGV